MSVSTDQSKVMLPLGQRERRTIAAVVLVSIGAVSLVLGPVQALGLLGAVALVWALLRFPDLGTSIALFLFYSNLVVIGVKFHGVPRVLGGAVALLLVIPLVYHLLVRRESFVLPRGSGWMVFLVAVYIVGALVSRNPELSLGSSINFLVEGLILFLAIPNIVRTKESLRNNLLVLLAAGCLMAAVPLFQQVTGDYENMYGGLGIVSGGQGFRTGEEDGDGEVRQKRLAGPIGEQNRYAQVMLVLVPIGILGFRGVSSPVVRRFALVSGILAAAGATVAFSRGAAVGFAGMLVIGFFIRYLGRRELIVMALGGVMVVMAAPQYVSRLFTLDSAIQVLVEGRGAASTLDDGAIAGRATEMGAAFMVFLEHPVIGVGPGMFRYYSQEYGERIGLRQLEGFRQAHSLIPDIAAEHGMAGLVGYFLVIGLTLRGLHRVRLRWLTDDPELALLASGLLLAIVTYLTVGMFMHRAYIRYFWILMGLAAAACSVRSLAAPEGARAVGGAIPSGPPSPEV